MGQSNQPSEQENPRPALRYRLWVLCLLFVAAAIYVKRLGQEPGLAYLESRSLFQQDGQQEILFSKLPDGTRPPVGAAIDSAYQSLGVTFSCGTLQRLENMKTSDPPLAQITIRTESGELTEQMEPSDQPDRIRSDWKLDELKLAALPKHENFVGISGHPFSSNDAQVTQSICNHTWTQDHYQKYTGPMTIQFHQANSPDVSAGVHSVGFYAAELTTQHAIQVRLYTPSGRLIGLQSNISVNCVFMGFKSKSQIGWIEIDPGGLFEGYAIGNLIFDEVE